MKRAVRVWLALVATAASLVWAKAEAQEAAAAVPVRIRYEAVAGCPGEEEFLAQLRARAPRVRRAAPDEEATTFDVAVAPEQAHLVGRLVLEERTHASRPSQVAARSCDDVVAALALIAALSIDPRASVASAPPRAGASSSTPGGFAGSGGMLPATLAAAAPGPATAAPPAAAPPPTPSPAAMAAEPEAPPPPGPSEPTAIAQPTEPLRDRISHRVAPSPAAKGALAHLSTGLDLDSVYAGVPVFARIGLHVRAGWSGGFSLGLGVAASQGSADQTQGGARLQWLTASVEACPFRLQLGAGLSVVPCVPLEGGMLAVTGTSVPNPVTQHSPWFTAGGLARLELGLGTLFLVEAHAGLAAPLVRDTFYFLPNTDVFRPAPVFGWGGLGVGVRFL